MMKRFSAVAVAVLVAVSSSFASWNYFPPNDAGEGEARLGFYFGMPMEKVNTTELTLGARYSIIDGLEASLILPLPMSYSVSGNSSDKYFGLSCPIIGVRYWLPMGVGFFGDFILPVDTRDGREPDFDMVLGVQFSKDFTEQLSLGSELRLENLITDSDIDMGIGLELDYNLGTLTPFLGLEFGSLLGKSDVTFDLIVGAIFQINDKMGADAYLEFGLAGYGDKNTPMTIGAHLVFGF